MHLLALRGPRCRLQGNTCCSFSCIAYVERNLKLFLSSQDQDHGLLFKSHALIVASGNVRNVYFAAKLIYLYSIRDLNSAYKVFRSIDYKDTFLWNSIIKSYFSSGQYMEALRIYRSMRVSSILPDFFTIPMAVTSCGELKSLNRGRIMHGLTLKLGLFVCNSAIGSSFIYMYSKCGVMGDASLLFNVSPIVDLVSWTALVIGYLQNGDSEKALETLYLMHKMAAGCEERPNFRTLEGGIHACGNLDAVLEGRCLHGLTIKSGYGSSLAVQSSLLSMYSKCGTLVEAETSFLEVMVKDVVCWTSVISAYAKSGMMKKCIDLLQKMDMYGVQPDGILVSCIFLGLANWMRTIAGKFFHAYCLRRGYALDYVVYNAMLSMYCKFGLISYAEKLFHRDPILESESWNTMVLCYRKVGLDAKCIEVFRDMRSYGIELDSSSLISAIYSCSRLGEVNQGRSVHCVIIKSLTYENILILNSLIEMYGSHGDFVNAWKLVSGARGHVTAWNALISCYSHSGHFQKAIFILDTMVSEEIMPDAGTFIAALSACSNISSSKHGEKVHGYIKNAKLERDVVVATCLIDMYTKCGELSKARDVFDSLNARDTTCWNAMISGYALHGKARYALGLFNKMDEYGVVQNEITFLAILSACSRAGLVYEGKYVFGKMIDYSLKPTLKHYTCMVDLLGRSGHLREAEDVILSMPIPPDGCLWGSLLGACRVHLDIEMGIQVAQHAIASEPENDGYYVLLCNMYASFGMWKEVDSLREIMSQRGVPKSAAWSSLTGLIC